MNFAVNFGYIKYNPTIKILNLFPKYEKKNFKTIKPEELPILIKEMEEITAFEITKLLFKFQLLTMVRSNEASGIKWEEIDFDNKIWNIPKERMKAKKPHFVP